MDHPLGYDKAAINAYQAALAPYRGNIKVCIDGTLYHAQTLETINVPGDVPRTYVYEVCVLDSATTFVGNLIGRFRNLTLGFDIKQRLDVRTGSIIEKYHVQIAGAPMQFDGRFSVAEAFSSVGFEDVLFRLAKFYQSAIENWVIAHQGPDEYREYFKEQLACHNRTVVLDEEPTIQRVPVEENIAVPSGNMDAAAMKPSNDGTIDPRLLLPMEEPMKQAAPDISAQSEVLEIYQSDGASESVMASGGETDAATHAITGEQFQEAIEPDDTLLDFSWEEFMNDDNF
ncbi:hypothetical protein P171DRAFT_482577 [Karstenula rhodostoma CBS 690.94]|uniref:Uncharacterized protein n=1 Tax=Karstenula rhodostoma CBS 690.94 TaxID=1392251 RepID=A0A9P4PPM1_9PLEO|nr:hypothetical protein P171DRAFT_482577 [Karstenula rhodostoma CBS 690.94]